MKLRQLKAVLAVATSGSMNAAARVLSISQPAITRNIAILEAELGAQLFRRTYAGTELTWQGEMLVRTGLKAMRRLRAIEVGVEEGIEAASIFRFSAFVRQVADHELAALVGTALAGSSRRAAEQMGLSLTAIDRSLATFSARLGRPLYQSERSRKLLPWAKDAAMLAKRALGEIAAVEEYLLGETATGATRARLRIGALPASRVHLVPEAVRRFASETETCDLSIVDAEYEVLLSKLHSGDIDLIVGSIRKANNPHWLKVDVLFNDHLVVAGHSKHPLQQLQEVDWWDLRSARWVLPSKSTPIRNEFDRLVSLNSMPFPSHVIEVDSFIAARSLLMTGEWLGVFSASQIIPEERSDLFRRLPLANTKQLRQVGVMTRNDEPLTQAQRKFIAHLRRVASDVREAISGESGRSFKLKLMTPKLK